jgi:spore coat polysaccharide biosynthesis protein SpsF
MTPGVILQARFASQRLPGKAVETIGGITVLDHCLDRLRRSGVPVVLATTTGREDDLLAGIAELCGVPVFRGERDDVLSRFVGAAIQFEFDPIIRATADNPAVDVDACRRVLDAFDDGIDYVREEGLPLGACVEGVRFSALAASAADARNPYDREHVTTFIRRHPDRFTTRTLAAPKHLRRPDVSLTVDTADDLDQVRNLFARTGQPRPSLAALLAATLRAA